MRLPAPSDQKDWLSKTESTTYYPHYDDKFTPDILLYEPLMSSGSYKKRNIAPKQTRNDPPASLEDHIHDIGKCPVQPENVKKFQYVYDENQSAFQGHQIADYELDGKHRDEKRRREEQEKRRAKTNRHKLLK